MRTRRLVLAGITAVLAVWAVALVVLTADRGAATSADGPLAIIGEPTSPFRGGPLPEGIEGARAPGFSLRDAHGEEISTSELRGRPYLVTFLYTDCPDVCPLIAQEIKLAFEQLGRRADEVTALAVSADPEGDTPAAVRTWLEQHRMPPNFRYLVGTWSELEPVWEAHFAAPQDRAEEQSAHSASIWLVDRDGRWRTKFSGGMPVPPQDIAHDLRILLDEPA